MPRAICGVINGKSFGFPVPPFTLSLKSRRRIFILLVFGDESSQNKSDERPTVIPMVAAIQKVLLSWIPGRASYRQLARNDAQIIQRISGTPH
jgi:hypothetical protein